jgi:Hypothetical protein (DUF2513)
MLSIIGYCGTGPRAGARRGFMKRDMDLVRAILLKLEEQIGLEGKTYNFTFENSKLTVPGYTDEEVYSHLKMLIESPSSKVEECCPAK